MGKSSNFKLHRPRKKAGNPNWGKGRSGNPRGLALPADLSLDELIRSDKFTPPAKLHRLLLKHAKTNPAALQHLLQRKAGPPPAAPPAPEPAPQNADLALLSVAQLEQLAALMAAAEGDPEPWRKLEKEQREKLKQMYPNNEVLQ